MRARGRCLPLLGLVLGACSEPPAPAPAAAPWFEEVAEASGLDFAHVRALTQRFWFPEIMGAGVGWLDYDGDGRLDLYCVQSGDLEPGERAVPESRLYRNLGGGRFEDVTARAGVGRPGYGMGCTTGDYDGDGDVDLYVTCVGANVLYRNEGDGTFRDVTAEAGVGDAGWGTSTGFFDLEGDGDLDLWLVNYVRWSKALEIECKSPYGERDYCAPNNYNAPSQSVLYVNEGDGRFRDASKEAGLGAAFGNGLGLALADFDGDGRCDVYVSNDGMPNQLWINRGGGRFENEALQRGCAVNRNGAAEASMGTVAGDFDQDGDPDVFISNLRDETNTLYDNDGKGNLRDVTPRSGLASAGLQLTGFGDGLADFDHDGFPDVFVANGRVGFWKPYYSTDDVYAEPKQLFRGLDGKRWEDVPLAGLSAELLGNSRGVALADWDDDGDVDLVVNENHGRLHLLRNVAPKRGQWVTFDVQNRAGAPALGARLRVQAGARAFHGAVSVCSSYCSANDPRVHFGLGSAGAVDEVAVRWSDGTAERFGPFASERFHLLRQGAGRAER